METVKGTFQRERYRSTDSNFAIGAIFTGEKEKVTIAGEYNKVAEGEKVTAVGTWEDHPKFGRQLKLAYLVIDIPNTESGLVDYLKSVSFRIGPTLARALVRRFGTGIINIIENEPNRLTEVHGIGKKRSMDIVRAWQENSAFRDAVIYLHGVGVPSHLIKRVARAFGNETKLRVHSNPYNLMYIDGVAFTTADTVASRMGIDSRDPRRVKACVLFVLRSARFDGHCLLPIARIVDRMSELAELNFDEIMEHGLGPLMEENRIVHRHFGNNDYFTTSEMDDLEEMVAQRVIHLSSIGDVDTNVVGLDETIDNLAEDSGLTEEQTSAVRMALTTGMTIITGGPGTGKTFVIRSILNAIRTTHNVWLCAPTGRAAKRIEELTGQQAQTIHRMLGYDPMFNTWLYNEDNPVEADFVIVDEASMLDIHLAGRVLAALSPTTRLVMVGDVDQLPSVGPGNVLRDVIATKMVSTQVLTEIFRQSAESMIISNAHLVNHGHHPQWKPQNGQHHDMTFSPRHDAEDVVENVLEVVRWLEEKRDFSPLEDIQVLVPMRRGDIGLYEMNNHLQQAINPGGLEVLSRQHGKIRVGDRVIHVKNNYKIGVFNGEVGVVVSEPLSWGQLTDDEKAEQGLEDIRLWVKYPDRPAPIGYSNEYALELQLAYALTIHKSQGGQYPAVVLVIHHKHSIMMARNLLYTGITRGEKFVHVVGTDQAVDKATRNDTVKQRYTSLKERVLDLL